MNSKKIFYVLITLGIVGLLHFSFISTELANTLLGYLGIDADTSGVVASFNVLLEAVFNFIGEAVIFGAILYEAVRRVMKKEDAKESLGVASTYNIQSQKLERLRTEYTSLVAIDGETDETEQLKLEIISLDERLKDFDKSIGQVTTSGGNYGYLLGANMKGVKIRSKGAIGKIVEDKGDKFKVRFNDGIKEIDFSEIDEVITSLVSQLIGLLIKALFKK